MWLKIFWTGNQCRLKIVDVAQLCNKEIVVLFCTAGLDTLTIVYYNVQHFKTGPPHWTVLSCRTGEPHWTILYCATLQDWSPSLYRTLLQDCSPSLHAAVPVLFCTKELGPALYRTVLSCAALLELLTEPYCTRLCCRTGGTLCTVVLFCTAGLEPLPALQCTILQAPPSTLLFCFVLEPLTVPYRTVLYCRTYLLYFHCTVLLYNAGLVPLTVLYSSVLQDWSPSQTWESSCWERIDSGK